MPVGSDLLRRGARVASRIQHALQRRVLPVTVLLGFALLFVLWLVTQLNFIRGIDDVEARAAAITLRYVRAEELLTTMRTQRFLASIYLRDALLDPLASNTVERRRQIDEARRQINEALSAYAPFGSSASERTSLEQLRQALREYWDTVTPVLMPDVADHFSEARDLLLQSGTPRREAVNRISDRIQELNRVAFIQQQAEVGQAYRTLDRGIRATTAMTLVAGLLIVVVVTGYAGRLERRIREQLARNARTARDLRRLSAKLVHAQEEERRTIARELHDEIGQALTTIKVELGVAQQKAEQSGQLGNLLDVAKGCTDDAIETARNLSQLLHPSLLDHLGLPAALEWYLQGFSRRTGIRADLTTAGVDGRFAPEVETCIYRIAQEGLTNVARHAEATTCRVHLRRLADTLLLTVEDNGKGFDVQQLQSHREHPGLGLLGVRERVSGFGGTFKLETTVGRGTTFTVELPCLVCSPEEDTDDSEPVPAPAEEGRRP
jgi:signal transduction histidine kinase